jgi:TonB family protein
MPIEQLEDERTRTPVSTRPQAARDPLAPPSQRDLAFKTFGVLDAGKQTSGSVYTSLGVNGVALVLIVLLSLTAKKIVKTNTVTTLTAPVVVHHDPPPEPKPLPRPKLPKPPEIKVEQPKVEVPKIEVPEPPKVQPVVAKAPPVPTPTPPAPKAVTPPPAPRPVAVNIAQAAAVPNQDPRPSAVRLGSMSNPINNTAGPAVSPVNLGRSGAPGMNSSNTGLGGPTKVAISGSGSPNGSQNGRDSGPQPIKGLSNGVPGSNGPANARPVGAVQIARNDQPVAIHNTPTVTAAPKSAPKLLYKPRPEYTEEARALHLEGTVYVKIHVSAAGAVSVVGVQSGLGHGLDQAAVRAVEGMRFQPAVQNGQPTDWDGVVNINFQLAG